MVAYRINDTARHHAAYFVRAIVDDALGVREVQPGDNHIPENARLVGWQGPRYPIFVAVTSYLPGIRLDDDEALELAKDYMRERGWPGKPAREEPDYLY